jgi:hypothetical protein
VAAASAPRISFADGSWTLASAAGDDVRLSVDYTRAERGDKEFSFDAAPFAAAGLDPSKLPSSATWRIGGERAPRTAFRARFGGALDGRRKTMEAALAEWCGLNATGSATTALDTTASSWAELTCSSGPRIWRELQGYRVGPQPEPSPPRPDPTKVEGWIFARWR